VGTAQGFEVAEVVAQVQVWATPATRYVSLAGSRSVSPHHPHRTAIGKSIKAHVKHQLGPACQGPRQASAGTGVSRISRDRTAVTRMCCRINL
jgi:hypothetical protein